MCRLSNKRYAKSRHPLIYAIAIFADGGIFSNRFAVLICNFPIAAEIQFPFTFNWQLFFWGIAKPEISMKIHIMRFVIIVHVRTDLDLLLQVSLRWLKLTNSCIYIWISLIAFIMCLYLFLVKSVLYYVKWPEFCTQFHFQLNIYDHLRWITRYI